MLRFAALIGFALVMFSLFPLSLFNVPEDSEALVLRGAEVHRKVGPGVRYRILLLEHVVIEPVLRERQFSYDAPFDIQGCRADVSVIYRIGDLEAYHASGGDLTALREKRGEIGAVLDALPELSEFAETATPYANKIAERLRPITGPVAGGLHINRVTVSLEDGCEPKRIVREEALAPVDTQPVGTLAPERAAPGTTRATTSDGVELQFEGFLATYEISDETRAEMCFGRDRDLIATRIGNLAERALIDVIETVSFDRLAEIPTKLQTAFRDNDLDQCGVVPGAVDFSEATIVRRSVLNCDETPIDDCLPTSIAVPGLSLPPQSNP